MKIAFVWYWHGSGKIYDDWRDGLRGAIEEIGKKHDVVVYLDKMPPDPDEDYDAILFWDDSNSDFFYHLDNYKCPKGLILTTNPQNWTNLRRLDVIFCESQPVYDEVRRQGLHAVKAFGTDTDFYKPKKSVKKYKYFYPATFSPWKRQSAIAKYGKDLHCIGTVQPDGQDELKACQMNYVNVELGYFPPEKIRKGYNETLDVEIPAIHGSERTVLEAMAMGIVPMVNPKNIRTASYVKEFEASDYEDPREFIIDNYSHKKYAKDIMKGFGFK